MSNLQVRIETLPKMRMISAYGFGAAPEEMAMKKMAAFMEEKGLLEGYGTTYPHYGFNNPSPSAGSPNYGYEIWVAVSAGVQPCGDLKEVQFGGGLYAVTQFENLEAIGSVWQALVQWREASPYQAAHHQWLERLFNPLEPDLSKSVFELYLPIRE